MLFSDLKLRGPDDLRSDLAPARFEPTPAKITRFVWSHALHPLGHADFSYKNSAFSAISQAVQQNSARWLFAPLFLLKRDQCCFCYLFQIKKWCKSHLAEVCCTPRVIVVTINYETKCSNHNYICSICQCNKLGTQRERVRISMLTLIHAVEIPQNNNIWA